jgi:hypothetical protein
MEKACMDCVCKGVAMINQNENVINGTILRDASTDTCDDYIRMAPLEDNENNDV